MTCVMVHHHHVRIGADLKERQLMNNTESDLFVHGLRSLMTQIGEEENMLRLSSYLFICICERSSFHCHTPGSIVAHADHRSDGRRCPGRWAGAGFGLWPSHCWWVTSEPSPINPELDESASGLSPSDIPLSSLQVMVMGYERGCDVLFTAVTDPVILDQWLSLNGMVEDSSIHLRPFLWTDNSLIHSL